MSRSEHFAAGSGMVDVFHGTDHGSAREIKESGFSASYSDSSHFVDTPEAARSWAPKGAVVHLRAPAHELDYHGPGPGHDDKQVGYYGLPPDEDDMPGRLDASRVHCIDGACTRRG